MRLKMNRPILCPNPVISMAAARNRAEATSTQAAELNPERAMPRAASVPTNLLGFADSGEMATRSVKEAIRKNELAA